MKWILVIALIGVVFGTKKIDDNLKQLMEGYLQGLGIDGTNSTMPCAEDAIMAVWQAAVDDINKIHDFSEKYECLLGFSAMIRPTLETIMLVEKCNPKEISPIMAKIEDTISNEEEFVRAVMGNIDAIGPALFEIKTGWDAKNFVKVGQVTGTLLRWVYAF